MAKRTRRWWAFLVAAALGVSGLASDAQARGGPPKKPSIPKPLGTPKSPVKLPALTLWGSPTSPAS